VAAAAVLLVAALLRPELFPHQGWLARWWPAGVLAGLGLGLLLLRSGPEAPCLHAQLMEMASPAVRVPAKPGQVQPPADRPRIESWTETTREWTAERKWLAAWGLALVIIGLAGMALLIHSPGRYQSWLSHLAQYVLIPGLLFIVKAYQGVTAYYLGPREASEPGAHLARYQVGVNVGSLVGRGWWDICERAVMLRAEVKGSQHFPFNLLQSAQPYHCCLPYAVITGVEATRRRVAHLLVIEYVDADGDDCQLPLALAKGDLDHALSVLQLARKDYQRQAQVAGLEVAG